MFQKIPQRWTCLGNNLSPYNGTYVYFKNLANSGDITNDRGSKSASFTCLEECFGFCVSLWCVFEVHGEVQAFWLVQACLPIACVCWGICLICTLLTWGKTNGPWSSSCSLFDLQQQMPWRGRNWKVDKKTFAPGWLLGVWGVWDKSWSQLVIILWILLSFKHEIWLPQVFLFMLT